MATTAKIVAEMAEIKNSLNFMSREISEVVEQQRKLTGLMEEIRQLKIIIQQKDERIDLLEQRVDEEVQIEQAFSFIHFNCRSLSKHFSEIKYFLETLKGRFKLIALSETWIKKDKEVNLKL